MDNFKEIHIGKLIEQAVAEQNIDTSRICNFFKCSDDNITKMLLQENLPTDILLKWSKLLEYDFFRLYSQHLILYAPSSAKDNSEYKIRKTALPQFRKNIYTREVIDFILKQIQSKEMTISEVMQRYRIPKTTLYKWLTKHNNKD